MTPFFGEEFSTRLIDRDPFVVMDDMTPPRDPDENGDAEDVEEGDGDEGADEPPVVREPDE